MFATEFSTTALVTALLLTTTPTPAEGAKLHYIARGGVNQEQMAMHFEGKAPAECAIADSFTTAVAADYVSVETEHLATAVRKAKVEHVTVPADCGLTTGQNDEGELQEFWRAIDQELVVINEKTLPAAQEFSFKNGEKKTFPKGTVVKCGFMIPCFNLTTVFIRPYEAPPAKKVVAKKKAAKKTQLAQNQNVNVNVNVIVPGGQSYRSDANAPQYDYAPPARQVVYDDGGYDSGYGYDSGSYSGGCDGGGVGWYGGGGGGAFGLGDVLGAFGGFRGSYGRGSRGPRMRQMQHRIRESSRRGFRHSGRRGYRIQARWVPGGGGGMGGGGPRHNITGSGRRPR